ncbi:S8/S53 family peptidase [Streptosporangium fragile]|uniref:S8/S53 family peptidase n=1 Tax=Streptosporangium fragile TaxID=46186 RepID=A0ABN3W5B5_9ACTN
MGMAPDRFREQFHQIQQAMADVPLAAGPAGAPQFLYEKGYVLARESEAEEVAELIRDRFREEPGREEQVERVGRRYDPGGVARIRVGRGEDRDPWSDRDVTDALEAVRGRERETGRRMVTRNHVVSIAVNCCPGDEPVPVAPCRPPNPAVDAGAPGGGTVRVLVVDTGLVTDYDTHSWIGHVGGRGKREGEVDTEGILKQYVGHGTFITGLIGAVAPHADITVHNTLENAGAILEKDLGDRLLEDLAALGRWPDIISLSAGTPTTCVETLLGLERFMERLAAEPRTLLVAAAGNNGSDERFWPAAYAGQPEYADVVVSVGALRKDGSARACFSNHGPWVKAYAPGERLVSAFTAMDGTPVRYDYQHSTYDHCRYGSTYDCTCQFPPHRGELTENMAASPTAVRDRVEFDGLAQWSGTSFATPLVVGMIVNHMMANPGVGSRQAARDLLAGSPAATVQGRSTRVLFPPTWTPSAVQEAPPLS